MASIKDKLLAIGAALAYPQVRLKPAITKEHFSGKWVLVTGASHGIGRALTEKLIDADANVFLIARSEAELNTYATELSRGGTVLTTVQ